MKLLAVLIASCGLALVPIAIRSAAAKDPPQAAAARTESNLPAIKFEGKAAVTLRYGDLSVTLDSEPGSDADSRVPVFTGRYRDQVVFSIRIEDAEGEAPQTEARMLRLDLKTSVPQVVMTAFTGGAHCCTVTKIATALTPDQWRVLDAGQLDGDGYQFVDVDNDGAKELISADIAFLYAFDSYAASYAPARIAKLDGSDINDVTDEPRYRGFLRRKVEEMEADARKDPKLWHSNGFLGGWVAAKSLIGQFDNAWRRMLSSYDRKSDWSLDECTTGEELDKCPKDKLRQRSFPEALKELLESNSYPMPNGDKRR
jgi:hypothetical protein